VSRRRGAWSDHDCMSVGLDSSSSIDGRVLRKLGHVVQARSAKRSLQAGYGSLEAPLPTRSTPSQPLADRSIYLARVAGAASRSHVGKCVVPTARQRNHMVLAKRRRRIAAVGAASSKELNQRRPLFRRQVVHYRPSLMGAAVSGGGHPIARVNISIPRLLV